MRLPFCFYVSAVTGSFIDEFFQQGNVLFGVKLQNVRAVHPGVAPGVLRRDLMLRTGKDPLRYRPSDCIVPKYSYAKVIHKAMPEIRTFHIWVSMHMQKFLTNLMICNDGGRRRALIGRILKLGGQKHSELIEHFMLRDPYPGCDEQLSGLQERFDEALRMAPDYLKELFELRYDGKPLSERWHHTYVG